MPAAYQGNLVAASLGDMALMFAFQLTQSDSMGVAVTLQSNHQTTVNSSILTAVAL